MNIMKTAFLSTIFCMISFLASAKDYYADINTEATPRFEAGKGRFMVNGEPVVIKSAELHYPRIPRQYWDQRIKLCKALGMNTICLCVFWNIHEAAPDEFDFSGQNDIAEFVRLCKANDMYVILRPGPYICAEWEMGGLPWWLLKRKIYVCVNPTHISLNGSTNLKRQLQGRWVTLPLLMAAPL